MPTTRISKLARIKRKELAGQVVQLRETNTPFRVIGKLLKINEDKARQLAEEYYSAVVANDGMTALKRVEERRAQLEAMDAREMRIVASGPDAKLLAAGGYTIEEWQRAVESSRRIKADIAKLEGLVGPTGDRGGNSKINGGVEDGVPPQTLKELRSEAVQDFLIRLLSGQPEAFRLAVNRRIAEIIGGGDAIPGADEGGPRQVTSGSRGAGDSDPGGDIPLSGAGEGDSPGG